MPPAQSLSDGTSRAPSRAPKHAPSQPPPDFRRSPRHCQLRRLTRQPDCPQQSETSTPRSTAARTKARHFLAHCRNESANGSITASASARRMAMLELGRPRSAGRGGCRQSTYFATNSASRQLAGRWGSSPTCQRSMRVDRESRRRKQIAEEQADSLRHDVDWAHGCWDR